MGTTRMSSCSAAAGAALAAVLLAGCPQQTNPVDVLTETSMTEILEEAQAKFDAHQYTDALAMYKWAIERDPDNAEYHYLAGMCLLLTEQYEKGEYYFRTALARAPGMMAACRGLAMCLSGEGKVREAAAEVREVCRLNDRNAEAYLELGRWEHKAGNLEAALAAYTTAVRLAPDSAAAHLQLGLFYEAIGRIDPALAQVRVAEELKPSDQRIAAQIAETLARLRWQAAERQPEGPP
jgi:tetratricopeptide (TPR) repeat protein